MKTIKLTLDKVLIYSVAVFAAIFFICAVKHVITLTKQHRIDWSK